MNRRWVCFDVWMDIFPLFDHAQLGLKLALISPRFNSLVDKHFDGKRELTIWGSVIVSKDSDAAVAKLFVFIGANFVGFPLPDQSLPSKIRFNQLEIEYIDHSVIAFLRSNQQIFDKGTNLRLNVPSSEAIDVQPIWDDFVREIWPLFAPYIRHLDSFNVEHWDNLRRLISPTFLTDLINLLSIHSGDLFPDAIADDFDGQTATSPGQALSKWLHIPTTDGQPKRLRCYYLNPTNAEWINDFKEKFHNATTSVRYKIQLTVEDSTPIMPFELVNERTKETLTLIKTNENEFGGNSEESDCQFGDQWILKRCQNGETALAVQWKDENLNNVIIDLRDVNYLGPLPPPPEIEEKAGQSSEKGASSDNE